MIHDLTGTDGKVYRVKVTEKKNGITCQPWSFLGHAFDAEDLVGAAAKVADEASEYAKLHAAQIAKHEEAE